jgi:hypothetical protein
MKKLLTLVLFAPSLLFAQKISGSIAWRVFFLEASRGE